RATRSIRSCTPSTSTTSSRSKARPNSRSTAWMTAMWLRLSHCGTSPIIESRVTLSCGTRRARATVWITRCSISPSPIVISALHALDRARRIAGGQEVGSDGLRHHAAGGDDAPFADAQAGEDHTAGADAHAAADADGGGFVVVAAFALAGFVV